MIRFLLIIYHYLQIFPPSSTKMFLSRLCRSTVLDLYENNYANVGSPVFDWEWMSPKNLNVLSNGYTFETTRDLTD